MPVPTSFNDLSTTPASNSPAGSENVFPNLDDYIRFINAGLASIKANTATNGWVSPYLVAGSWAVPGTIGSTTPNSGAFTTLSASGAVSGAGFAAFLASPPAIGGTTAAAATFTMLNGGQLAGLRNRIINGDMRISQRGSVALANNQAIYGGADRFLSEISGFTTGSASVAAISGQAVSFAPSGVIAAIHSVTTTGAGVVRWYQRIESANSYSLNGKTITVSVNLFQDTGVTQPCDIAVFKANAADDFSAITLVGATTKSVAHGTALTYTFTLTLGSTDASNGLQILVSYTGIGAVTNKNFYSSAWQVESGSTPTPFELRPLGEELLLCQRYCNRIGGNQTTEDVATGAFISGTDCRAPMRWPVRMRAAPSVTFVGSAANWQTFGALTNTVSALAANTPSPDGMNLTLTVPSATAGQAAFVRINSSLTNYILASAEL